jgi:hypothetical protein
MMREGRKTASIRQIAENNKCSGRLEDILQR